VNATIFKIKGTMLKIAPRRKMDHVIILEATTIGSMIREG